MDKGKSADTRIDRRTALKLAAGAGIAGTGALRFAEPARAADTALTIWTGFPECAPFYQAVRRRLFQGPSRGRRSPSSAPIAARGRAEALGGGADRHRSRHLRHRHQHQRQLHRCRAARSQSRRISTSYLKSGAWNKFVVDFCTINGKTYGLPIWEGSKASMFYNKTHVQGGRPRSREAARDHGRARRRGAEAGEVRRLGQDDPQRHQPAPLGPGQRHHREVPLSPRRRRRLGHRQDGERQVPQRLRQRRRPRRRCNSSSMRCRNTRSTIPRCSTTPTLSPPATPPCCGARPG